MMQAKQPPPVTLGARIRARRQQLKLTIAAVARACGWDSIRVSGYESGRHEPSPESLDKLARALRTKRAELERGTTRLKYPGRRAGQALAVVQHRAPQSADARRRAQAERASAARRATPSTARGTR